MRILIAGATGVLGKRVVPLLIERGHEIVGLSRSSGNDEQLTRAGASSIRADLFDTDAITGAASGCDAVLHLATAIPPTIPGDWTLNDRIRREGTANLVTAALANGCRLYVQQSITFLYGHWGDVWVDERSPLDTHLSIHLQSGLDMEQIVAQATQERGLPAITLRFGNFYSADSALTQSTLRRLVSGEYRVPGIGDNFMTLVHADDAALAVIAAVEHEDRAGEIYNVGDDDPPRQRDYADALADMLGVERPLSNDDTGISTRCSNRKIAADLGRHPRYTTFREGFPAVIEQWRQHPS